VRKNIDRTELKGKNGKSGNWTEKNDTDKNENI
jgi:hypothetical protein